MSAANGAYFVDISFDVGKILHLVINPNDYRSVAQKSFVIAVRMLSAPDGQLQLTLLIKRIIQCECRLWNKIT